MQKSEIELISRFDGLTLSVEAYIPDQDVRAIVQISHGMAEHKERYEPFMECMANNGFVTVIHDHRGHGKSVKSKDDLGYFYTSDISAIVEDLHQVSAYIKQRYPEVPLFLFSHSMGTLVARNYIKKYDDEIEKLVLCGPPTQNKAVGMGLFLNKMSILFRGERCRSRFIDHLATGQFNKRFEHLGRNAWICSDNDSVKKYNNDEGCGFCFTNNGFNNLFKLQQKAFSKKGWMVKNPALPILMIAGENDPVIGNEKKFNALKSFLFERGYQKIATKIYPEKRHELLNEKESTAIMMDVINFFNTSGL